ncbi:uncharacterized protein LOC116851667, partial [Odontomachus brunneus]|uniref:uncharacterized protein LOC116851667 n=1 Tax=Odontomachus brunneus TaxID=486640 RepID=UPI0013F228C7
NDSKLQCFFFYRCLHYFHSNEKLESHAVDCEKLNDCAILLPSEDNKWLSFSNHSRKERVPFVVYADLECTLEKTVSEKEEEGCTSHAYQHHKVFSIAYYLRCSYDDSVSYFRSRRDTDCISWFVEQLEKLAHRVKEKLSTNVDMETLSKEQWAAFHNATQCHVCEKPFATKDTRVCDHCHFTGRYRGPAHSNCNLNYKNSYHIPIVFHNLSGYDSHFIIKEIANAFEGSIDVLPITKKNTFLYKEKYFPLQRTSKIQQINIKIL